MPVEQVKFAELHLVFGPYAYRENVPGVTDFEYDDESETQRVGANSFGARGPIAITDFYQGVQGRFNVVGSDGEAIVLAIANGEDPAQFSVDNPLRRYYFFIAATAYDEDGITPTWCHVIWEAKLNGPPLRIGPDARQYQFQAKRSKRIKGRRVRIQVYSGAATPVTSLPFAATPQQDDEGNFALVLLRQTQGSKVVRLLRKGVDYTETSTAITLTQGLAANERALVIYAATPS